MNYLDYKIAEEAAEYYSMNLKSESGKVGMEYLFSRGINEESIDRFNLGFACVEKDGLVRYLLERGYSKESILESGLAILDDTRKLVDKFVNRIMIPILNAQWRIIGFGGRTVANEEPKYLNSMDSVRYKLNSSVFGFNVAKDTKAKYMIICEGFMDVISLHQAGYDMAVASFGMQSMYGLAYELKGYVDKVFIAYKNDEAGKKAASRISEILRDYDITAYYLNFESFYDPDEVLRIGGKGEFENRIKNKIKVGKTTGYKDFCKRIGNGVDEAEDEKNKKHSNSKKNNEAYMLVQTVKEMLDRKGIQYDVDVWDVTEIFYQKATKAGILSEMHGSIIIDEEYNTCVTTVYPNIKVEQRTRRELEKLLFRINCHMVLGMWQIKGDRVRYVRSAIFPREKIEMQKLFNCLIKDVFDVVEQCEMPILRACIGDLSDREAYSEVLQAEPRNYIYNDYVDYRYENRLQYHM